MISNVNQITKRSLILLTLWACVVFGRANSLIFPTSHVFSNSTAVEAAYYGFSYGQVDEMLQLIEKHRNFKPSNAFLEYGVMFFPENNPQTNQLSLVAKACIIFPSQAVPINLPGNFFPGTLNGADFFDKGFLATFKKDPALANGATQAYTFAVLLENQVQVLLSANGVIGLKAYQVKVDYGIIVPPATTAVYYNLNIVNDIPGKGFAGGAQFFLAWPCPPWWKNE